MKSLLKSNNPVHISSVKEKKPQNFILSILLITLVIDIMGVGLVLPLVPDLVLNNNSHIFFDASVNQDTRTIYYALIMGFWPLGIFIGSTLLGRLSDIWGRKKLIYFSIMGVALSYFLSVYAIYLGNINLFIFSRLTLGFMGGVNGLVRAAIADIAHSKELKAKYIGYATLAILTGIIIGPSLSTLIGQLSGNDVLMKVVAPFLIAGIISLLSFITIFMLYQDTFQVLKKQKQKLNFFDILFSFRVLFIDKRIYLLVIAFLLLRMGDGLVLESLPLILSEKFHVSQTIIGIVFIIQSAGLIISQLKILPLLKNISLKKITSISSLVIPILFAVLCLFPSVPLIFIIIFVYGIFGLLLNVNLVVWLSNKVNDDEQGMIMGGTGSLVGLSMAVDSVLLTPLTNINMLGPIYIVIIFYLLSCFIIFNLKKENR
ncbi:hypothetical protein CF386_09840 [Paraphotobacterium marinum]|uniref:Major facilitator superfamily (MFS) profile domain-containing protein n=1 Tax=Paraphotobacterium marinum TaxID=1755811 RepID=A0A220VG35_9GAMM|nr:MFS transporter [Paraphotobacterium marinum]ASK79354.1 hypothetical protein CF386_09840 [Paraphotobacterium marinum]